MEVSIGGYTVLVDECDMYLFQERRRTWRVNIYDKNKYPRPYVVRTTNVNCKSTTYLLHRVIMNAQKGQIVDHINGNSLDNRRENLRIVTGFQNMKNMARRTTKTSSRFKGAHPRKGRWIARIMSDRKQMHLGTFDSEVEAAYAYDLASLRYHGEYGVRNFLPLVF